MTTLAERIMVLRDEVLDTVTVGDEMVRGAEIFEAIVRVVVTQDATDPGVDLALHDALSRRLAWGDNETAVITDTAEVCTRLMMAAQRSLAEPMELAMVAETVAEVGCAAARIVTSAAVGRTVRERGALLREQASQSGLEDALRRQQEEIARLTDQF